MSPDVCLSIPAARPSTLTLFQPHTTSHTTAPPQPPFTLSHRSCPGALWLSPERRYGFLDLGANTTFAGPGPGGRGQALAHAVPALSHYRPEAAARAIVPDLAALVWGAARHLAWPPLAHPYAEYHASVAVHVVCVRNDLGGAEPCVDRGRIEEELRAAVGGAQQIDVWEHQLPVGQCAECVTAVAE